MPALDTTMSRPPNASAAASMAGPIDISSVQSAGSTTARWGSAISAATLSRPSRPRAMSATLAPSAARRIAVARPMPLLAPVTTARFPRKRGGDDMPGACTPVESGIGRMRHLEVVGVTATGLDDALEPGLGIEEIPLDVIADVAECRDPDAVGSKLRLDPLGLVARLEHHRDRRDALALLLGELMEWITRCKRLDQLEVQIADHRLGPADLELGRLPFPHRVMHHPLAIRLVDLPRAPAEGFVVVAHLRVEVANRDRELGDRISDAADGRWARLRAWLRVDLRRLDEVDRVAASRLDQAAELRLSVQVVVLDVVADIGLHVHVDAEALLEGDLDRVPVLALEEH